MRRPKFITPELCRAARAILGWSQQELALRAEVARTTVADYELGQIAPHARTLRDLVAALEVGGIQFVPPEENVSRGGVILKWDGGAGAGGQSSGPTGPD
jgi:transcriptional regulator with XRE-family HTH domain